MLATLNIDQIDTSKWSPKTGFLQLENTIELTLKGEQWQLTSSPRLHNLDVLPQPQSGQTQANNTLKLTGHTKIHARGTHTQLDHLDIKNFNLKADRDSIQAEALWDRHNTLPKIKLNVSIEEIKNYLLGSSTYNTNHTNSIAGKIKLDIDLAAFEDYSSLSANAELTKFRMLNHSVAKLSSQINAQLPSVSDIRKILDHDKTPNTQLWLEFILAKLNVKALDIRATQIANKTATPSSSANKSPNLPAMLGQADLHLSGNAEQFNPTAELSDGFNAIQKGKSHIQGQLSLPTTLRASVNPSRQSLPTLSINVNQLELFFKKHLNIKKLSIADSPEITINTTSLYSPKNCITYTLQALGNTENKLCIDDVDVQSNGEFKLTIHQQPLPIIQWLNHSLFHSNLSADTDSDAGSISNKENKEKVGSQYTTKRHQQNWQLAGDALFTASVSGQWRFAEKHLHQFKVNAKLDTNNAKLYEYQNTLEQTDDDTARQYWFSRLHFALEGNEHTVRLNGELALDNNAELALNGKIENWQLDTRKITLALNGQVNDLQGAEALIPSLDQLSGNALIDLRYTNRANALRYLHFSNTIGDVSYFLCFCD